MKTEYRDVFALRPAPTSFTHCHNGSPGLD
jgi:hypothetical protein